MEVTYHKRHRRLIQKTQCVKTPYSFASLPVFTLISDAYHYWFRISDSLNAFGISVKESLQINIPLVSALRCGRNQNDRERWSVMLLPTLIWIAEHYGTWADEPWLLCAWVFLFCLPDPKASTLSNCVDACKLYAREAAETKQGCAKYSKLLSFDLSFKR